MSEHVVKRTHGEGDDFVLIDRDLGRTDSEDEEPVASVSQTSAMSSAKQAKWPFIVNLSNSIVGVSILAMPFCLQQCGILLGAVLLVCCNVLTRLTCHFLMKGAYLARRRSYEFLALQAFGPLGKTIVEVSLILFLMSTLCAFFVVIGDIGPHILADYLQLAAPTQRIRIFVMVVTALFFVLPLSLLRNLDSLSGISSMAIVFYGLFLVRMLMESLPRLVALHWLDEVNWWRPSGVLQCLPIFAMALSCQTQLFVVAECMVDPSPARMDQIVSGAVNLCSTLYTFVGLFGYVAFHDQTLHGDVLVLLESTFLTQLLKLGFMLSVAVSFPLMLFPCRAAIFNMFFRPTLQSSSDLHVDIIPDGPFKLLTLVVLFINLILAIMIPNVEFVLGLTGSLIGSIVCIICPAAIFLSVAPSNLTNMRAFAKLVAVVGVFMLVACTAKTLQSKYVADVADRPIPKIVDPLENIPPADRVEIVADKTRLVASATTVLLSKLPVDKGKIERDVQNPAPVRSPEERREPALPVQEADSPLQPGQKDTLQQPTLAGRVKEQGNIDAQDMAKRDANKEDKNVEDKMREDKLKENKMREDKMREDKMKEDKMREDKIKEDKMKEDTRKEDKAKEDAAKDKSQDLGKRAADADKLLKEIKQQQQVQETLIKKQQDIVDQLKQHHDEHHEKELVDAGNGANLENIVIEGPKIATPQKENDNVDKKQEA